MCAAASAKPDRLFRRNAERPHLALALKPPFYILSPHAGTQCGIYLANANMDKEDA
jgi:hypothetical protein